MKAIKTYFLPCTNFKPNRIVATTEDHNRIVISQPCDKDVSESFEIAAKMLCEKFKWSGSLIRGSFPKYDVFVFAPKERG